MEEGWLCSVLTKSEGMKQDSRYFKHLHPQVLMSCFGSHDLARDVSFLLFLWEWGSGNRRVLRRKGGMYSVVCLYISSTY